MYVWSVSMKFSRKRIYWIFILSIGIYLLVGCSSHQHVLGKYQYDDYLHWQECEDCHEIVNHVYHTYGAWQIVEEPTEEKEGKRRQVCSACGYFKEETVPILTHSHHFGSWEFVELPTNQKEGSIRRVCTVDSSHVETVLLPALNKTFYRYRILSEPSCSQAGLEIYSFVRDGQTLEIRQDMPITDHTYALEWSSDALGHWHQATCIHSSLQKDYDTHTYKNGYCTTCNRKEDVAEHVHTYGPWEIEVTPTLESLGQLKRVCLTNDAHIEFAELPALNLKDYAYEVKEESSCSQKGKGEYKFHLDEQDFFFLVDLDYSDHTYALEWTMDNRYHWHQATCIHHEEKRDYELHNFENGRCTTCGYIGYSEGLLYEMNEDHISYRIIGLGDFSDKELVLPGMYQGLPVTHIAANAFRNCTFIEKVRVLDGIIEFGDSTFMGCSSLRSIELPKTLKTIGSNCFEGCRSLKEFNGNDGLESMNNSVFKGCLELTSLSIPNSLLRLGTTIVDGCMNLNYTSFDNGLYLGNSENPYLILYLASDTLISSCVLHEKTKFIASSAFSECRSLKSIQIPDEVISIGNNSFYFCVNLQYVILGKQVSQIERGAFGNCSALKSLFYKGTKEEFQDIEISINNTFENIYYYSENPSSSEEWTFDENQNPVPFQ